MNRALGPAVVDAVAILLRTNNQESADNLLQQAQMEIASENPLFMAPVSTPEAVNNGAVNMLAKRLDALMPSL